MSRRRYRAELRVYPGMAERGWPWTPISAGIFRLPRIWFVTPKCRVVKDNSLW